MITLAQLKLQVRHRADMLNSHFVEDDELNYYVSNSYKELYDILVTAYQDYYMIAVPPQFTLTGVVGQNYFDLPEDFYKLRGVDISLDNASTWRTLLPFAFDRRNRQGNLVRQFDKMYRMVGSRIYITPELNAAGTYRLWYIPSAADLTDDADIINGVNGWEEYIIVDAAIKCLEKEESDTTVLERAKASLFQRILIASKNRDAGMPETISDISLSQFETDYPWGRF